MSPQVVARHSSHHFVNVKYGYFVFIFVDLAYPIYLYLTRKFYTLRWSKSGRSTSYLKLVSIPLTLKIFLWSFLILLIGFWNLHLGNDFVIHLKRFGRISYVLIPLDILLSFKPCPIPFNNYLDMLVLHKWISRLIIICAIFHSIGFFIRWSLLNSLSRSTAKPLNALGIVVFALFSILIIISIRPIRRFFYKFFYIFHMITVWSTVILIGFHARPGVTIYSCICALLLIYQIYSRIRYTKNIEVLNYKKPIGASLALITLSKTLPAVFSPASHIRLSFPLTSFQSWIFPTHPYTIATHPSDKEIKLIVKETHFFKLVKFEQYSVTGPYESLPLNFFQTAENICIICGGSGISYGLPIYSHFKKAINNHSVFVKLIWITKNKNDLYLLNDLQIQGIEIFITADKSSFIQNVLEPENNSNNNGDSKRFTGIKSQADFRSKNIAHYGNRPILNECFRKNLIKTADTANKWVIACGPQSLINDCEKFAKQKKTRFASEVYAM
ncbi:hypothetical protein PACTADRAFT_64355 [Pachysolen tannophilus NRRL Y-2460]|uniref:Probable metalloreductase AIM14 n=1 Tax=Pachysolen tannophilus NRRL Y-2460 TaxID=669874 RepID=A0A1E4U309_PACTA|nr:hypothetical protein PACTADRAFT_64355 [Pachysolen tannophilus NRRL Y-2460]